MGMMGLKRAPTTMDTIECSSVVFMNGKLVRPKMSQASKPHYRQPLTIVVISSSLLFYFCFVLLQ